MTPSTPSSLPPAPASESQPRAGISPRKLILGLILAGSIPCFFLILAAGIFAILREAAPPGHSAGTPFGIVKHIVAHFILHRIHHH